jgi:hypothetical protein
MIVAQSCAKYEGRKTHFRPHEKGGSQGHPRKLLSLFLVRDRDNLPALIKAAAGADPMGRFKRATLDASGKRGRGQLVAVGPSFVSPCARDLFLWYRHESTSLIFIA